MTDQDRASTGTPGMVTTGYAAQSGPEAPRAEGPLDLFRIYDECGKDGYPMEWHRMIKYLVREQAGHRCARCHHPYIGAKDAIILGVEKSPSQWSPCDGQCRHGGPMRIWTTEGWAPFDPNPAVCGAAVDTVGKAEAEYRILTVHHLNGVKADCRWHNLVAVCQRCHLNVQSRIVMDRPWPWPHNDWFKPYAAAFYAASILREELTRDETMARLDELLALGMNEATVERMQLG